MAGHPILTDVGFTRKEVWLMSDSELFGRFIAMGSILGIIAIFVLFVLWVWGTIFKKMGRSRSFSVLLLIPVVNAGVMIWMAVSEWPIEKQVKELQAALAVYQARDKAEHRPGI